MSGVLCDTIAILQICQDPVILYNTICNGSVRRGVISAISSDWSGYYLLIPGICMCAVLFNTKRITKHLILAAIICGHADAQTNSICILQYDLSVYDILF